MLRKSKTLAALVLPLVLGLGCKTANKQAPIGLDSGVSSLDANQEPTIWLNVQLSHLTTGHPATKEFRLTVSARNVPLDDAAKQVKARFLLSMLPAKTAIAGDWTSSTDNIRVELVFTPKVPLAVDREYLLQVPRTALIKSERDLYAFRVGSLPRIIAVFLTSRKGGKGPIDMLGIRFSEFVDTNAVASALSVRVTGKLLALTLVNPGIKSSVVLFAQAGGIALGAEHMIEVGLNVGLPVKLDSEYTGKEGTAPFRLTLKPSDYPRGKRWEPDLKF